jgi:copper chaperone CopZ
MLPDASGVSMQHVHHGETIAVPSACVFLALLAWFAWSDAKKFWTLRGGEGASEESLRFHVTGMTCGGCVNRLQRVLGEVDGVATAMVTLEPGEAVVVGTASRETLREAIETAGFGAEDKPI